MPRKKYKQLLKIATACAGMSLVLATPVLAETPAQKATDASQKRLDANRRRVCQERTEKIKQLIRRSADQGQDHLAVFDRISQRVQNFYKTKHLSVANYNQLVSDVTAKRFAAVSAINTVRSTTFSCAADDPKGMGELAKANIRKMHEALKDYRTSIKNLTVAVRGASK